MSGKVSKRSVGYRKALPLAFSRSCGGRNGCSMFQAPGSCTLVAGRIKPQDVCDRWEKR